MRGHRAKRVRGQRPRPFFLFLSILPICTAQLIQFVTVLRCRFSVTVENTQFHFILRILLES